MGESKGCRQPVLSWQPSGVCPRRGDSRRSFSSLPRVDLLPRLGRLSDPRSHVWLEGRRADEASTLGTYYVLCRPQSRVRSQERGARSRGPAVVEYQARVWELGCGRGAGEGSDPAWVIHAKPSASQHGEGVVLRIKDFSPLSRHPVLNEPRNHSSFSRGRLRLKRRDGRRRVDTSR